MSGAVTPASSIRCLISGTASAASGRFTVTRTISEPASASSMHCCAVAAAFAVSVIVIDWTTTGAPPPTWTVPTRTPIVLWTFKVDKNPSIIAPGFGVALASSVLSKEQHSDSEDVRHGVAHTGIGHTGRRAHRTRL